MALRKSASWRITVPVRLAGAFTFRFTLAVQHWSSHVMNISVKVLHYPIAVSMRAVLLCPEFSTRLSQRLAHYPGIYHWLLNIADRAKIISSQPMVYGPDQVHLTRSADQIYCNLKCAIENRQKRRG